MLRAIFRLKNVFPLGRRQLVNYVFEMNKAYLRCDTETQQFHLTFHYVNSQPKVDRVFNFTRRLQETVGDFLNRVATNVSKQSQRKKKATEEVVKEDDVNLFLGGAEVNRDLSCSELFRTDDNMKNVVLQVSNQRFEVIYNSPWINSVSLPNSSLANYPVYPSKLESFHMDVDRSNFEWYRSLDKVNWQPAADQRGFVYVPTNDDIGYHLKLCCKPKNRYAEGPHIETVSAFKVEADPGHCPFQDRHQFTAEKLSGKSLRFVSYNILADLYCDSDFSRTTLFPYCPPYALAIDYRKQLILKELVGYNADIICLQEVDTKVFKYNLTPVFVNLGYNVLHQTKGVSGEGLACIYRSDRFRELDVRSVCLGSDVDKNPIFEDIWTKISENAKLVERLTQRMTTLHAIALESLENENQILLVANTHLYFHPDADHIRLLQGSMAIRYLVALVNELKIKTGKEVALVFCGDFNSVPECGIYKLYTTGHISKDCLDWRSNAEEEVKELDLSQPMHLQSAYGTPKFTNYTVGFKDCLDYIYYDSVKLKVLQVVPLPTDDDLRQHIAIPSVVSPSDHIALVADLDLL